jgi:curved DNA-binding protein CbpA
VTTHYSVLGLPPSASVQQIHQSYRDLSRQYHPDTTQLPPTIATQKFQQLNEAYAVLSNISQRFEYDQTIRAEIRPIVVSLEVKPDRSSYLDPNDRPLSAGELFVVLVMVLTFLGCLLLAIGVGVSRGELAL